MRSPFPGVSLVRIHHNAGRGEVVILVQRTRAGIAYGHAAGRTLTAATLKATAELARADFVIAAHRAKGAVVRAANFLERRALHFSTDTGYEQFLSKLGSKPTRPAPTWKAVFDGEITGPWARWATVWRCAVAMPTNDFLEPDADFFFW